MKVQNGQYVLMHSGQSTCLLAKCAGMTSRILSGHKISEVFALSLTRNLMKTTTYNITLFVHICSTLIGNKDLRRYEFLFN